MPAAFGLLLSIAFGLLFSRHRALVYSLFAMILAFAGGSLAIGVGAIILDGMNGQDPAPVFERSWLLAPLPAFAVSLLALTGFLVCRAEERFDQVVLALASAVLATTTIAIAFAVSSPDQANQMRAMALIGPAISLGLIAFAALGWRMRHNRAGYFSSQTPGWRAVRLSLPVAMLLPADRFLFNTYRPLLTPESAMRADLLIALFNLLVIVLLFNWAMGRIAREFRALSRAESRMALAIEAPGAGIFDWDVETGALNWTPKAERSIGLEPGELTTIDMWRSMLLPADDMAIEARVREVAEVQGESFSVRFRLRTRSGEIRTFEGSARCFYDEEGGLNRVVGMNLDVTERDEREAALVASEAQLRSIIENVPDALIVIDESGAIRNFSAAAERMFGYAAADVLGDHVAMLMPTDQSAQHDDQVARYLSTAGERGIIGRAVTLSARRSDGEVFPVELTVGEALGGEQRLFIAFVRDISERISAQQRLEELRDEFAHSARLSAMGEMAAGLAHELNQPLAAGANFLGAAEMLAERKESDPELIELLNSARSQLLRAGEIIRRLRDFLAKGSADMRVEPLDRTIREAVALGMVGNQQHQIETRIEIEPGATAMLADRVQVQQVLVNLLRNAAEAVRDCPRDRRVITITARPVSAEMLEVSVADRGPGLPQTMLEQLYTPFLSTKGKGGLGIGLSICRRIVEAHGGTMIAANLPEGGARIAFTLPKSHTERLEHRA